MAFRKFPTGNTSESNDTGRNDPDAYINIALPLADGSTAKIDRGLRIWFDGKDGEQNKALAAFLQTEEGAKWFAENVVMTCNYANVPKAGFAFPAAEEASAPQVMHG